jgi:hypothetical protein
LNGSSARQRRCPPRSGGVTTNYEMAIYTIFSARFNVSHKAALEKFPNSEARSLTMRWFMKII